MSEIIVNQSQQLNNSDQPPNNFSTHETGLSDPEQSMENNGTFSHLFPVHLYTNRDLSSLQIPANQTYDIQSKPFIGKDMKQDAYDRMPIEDFGKSVLSKFGWTEGKAVGRLQSQQNKVVQPIEYMPRQHRLGLGAKPLTKEQLRAMGDDYDKRKLVVTEDYQTEKNGMNGINFKSIHSQLQKKERMQIGSRVYITKGTHKDMEGKIVAIMSDNGKKKAQLAMGEEDAEEIDPESYVSVELIINGSIVNVKRKRLILKSHKDQLNPNDSSQQPIQQQPDKNQKDIKRSRSRSQDSSNKRRKEKKQKKQKPLKWIIPGIIVRCVSKKVKDGKLYNKKLRISDVLNQFTFLAVPDTEGESNMKETIVFDDLREKDLETVLPKDHNQPVAILKGEFKGEIGKILNRDRKNDEVTIQVGLVDIVKVSQDDCCAVYGDHQ